MHYRLACSCIIFSVANTRPTRIYVVGAKLLCSKLAWFATELRVDTTGLLLSHLSPLEVAIPKPSPCGRSAERRREYVSFPSSSTEGDRGRPRCATASAAPAAARRRRNGNTSPRTGRTAERPGDVCSGAELSAASPCRRQAGQAEAPPPAAAYPINLGGAEAAARRGTCRRPAPPRPVAARHTRRGCMGRHRRRSAGRRRQRSTSTSTHRR